jgi:CBS domain-containing protein
MLKLGEKRGIRLSKWARPETKVLDIASKSPVTCSTDQKVKDVLGLFANKYRRLPVLDGHGYVRGMLSATDMVRVLGGWGKYGRIGPKDRLETKLKRIMSSHVFHLDKNKDLPAALSFFKQHRLGAYPVLYRKNLLGVVTEWDFVRQIRGNTGVKIAEIMVRKPIVAQSGYGIIDVAKMLGMGGFRRLPVLNKGVLVGMVTPRDILRFLVSKRIPHKLEGQTQSVKGIMEKRVVTASPNQDVHEAVKIMIGQKIGGLPVMEDHELAGIVTERDVVDAAEF